MPVTWERHMRELDIAKLVAREHYAWPGGYEMAIVTHDAGLLCFKCVRREWREIAGAYVRGETRGGWYPAGMTHTGEMEQIETCDHCGRIIYDPDA
jgi:hypothetical protein